MSETAVVVDVAYDDRAMVSRKAQGRRVPGLRVIPVGIVNKRNTIHIMHHDMTFEQRDGDEERFEIATT